MNPADEMAAKTVTAEGQSAGAVAGSNDQIEEQLRATLKELQRNQSKLAEDLQSHLLRISHHLDYETSERKAVYDRLRAIDNQTKRTLESQAKRRGSRGLRPLPGCYLYWCCSNLGLAILRRGGKTDNRNKGSRTWLVAGGEADDRKLGPATWLDEAAGRRKQSGTRYPDCAREGRAESARCPLPRPGAGASDSTGCRRATANR
jgi:hypothetical protein